MSDNPPPPIGDTGGSATPPNYNAPHPQPQHSQPPAYAAQPPQAYPPADQYGVGPQGFGGAPQSLSKATTAMILGIVGLVTIPLCGVVLTLFLGPAAFFVGRSASKEIEANPGRYSNRGQAKAGWIMGLIQMVLTVLGIILLVGLFAGGAFDTSDF